MELEELYEKCPTCKGTGNSTSSTGKGTMLTATRMGTCPECAGRKIKLKGDGEVLYQFMLVLKDNGYRP